MPVFGAPEIMFERGQGTELWDVHGKRYLDFLAGIAVVSLGHANPVIAEAISDQARRLLHVSNFFTNPVAAKAARMVNEQLAEASGRQGQIFFTNSGAESVECAIKLARKHGGRGRHTVVSALGSFHGRTLAALAATGQPTKHEPFQPMPEGFRHVAWGELDAMQAAVDGSVAAVLIEPVQGEGGVNPATAEYLQGIRALCDEVGALLMIDEIQTGFGRTGRWFGFEHAGVQPDVVTLAKAMGNGMPVGACWARTDVASVFEPGDHGSTYSGTAIATAAVGGDPVGDAPARRAGDGRAAGPAAGRRPARPRRCRRGAWSRPDARRPARRRHRCEGGVPAAAPSGPDHQRRERVDAALRAAAHGVRRRDRRGARATRRRAGPRRRRGDTRCDRRCDGMSRHLLTIADFEAAEIEQILALAAAPIDSLGRPLDGLGAALIFEKPSNRTRHSTEMAVVQLGGHPIYTRGEEVGFDTREPVEDVAQILAGYHAVIAARVFSHHTLERMAAVVDTPVVNLLSDWSHPLQAFADALTMTQALGPLAGRTVAYVGDYNNVARSLAEVSLLLGARVRLASPLGFAADDAELDRLRLIGGGDIEQSHRPVDAVRGADAVHTDTWVSMGQEAEKEQRRKQFEGYTRRRRHDGARRVRGDLHALPAGLPRCRSGRRGDRRAAIGRVPTGPQPDACGPRCARLRPRSSSMTTKVQRQATISRLIGDHEVTNQPQLIALLVEHGIEATQATVSRDLDDIGAVKVRVPSGNTVYAIPEFAPDRIAPVDQLRRVMGEWVAEVAWSGNIVILRTPPGCAHVVGSALDRSRIDGLLGTVAGDDTLMCVSSSVDGSALAEQLKELAGVD